MAHKGVSGKVVNERVNRLKAMAIQAYDAEILCENDLLGSAVTTSARGFAVTYPKSSYGLEARPNLQLRGFNSLKRLLYEPEEFSKVSAPVSNLPTPIADAVRDFDRLGKTIEDNRNCFLFVFGTWVTDTSHEHNEIHDIEAVTIIECDVKSTQSGLRLAGAVGIGRHPSDLDP